MHYMDNILGTYCKARPKAGIMQTKARQQQGKQRLANTYIYKDTQFWTSSVTGTRE